jgi:hypothetical protein
MTALDAYRDDGPLARAIGRALALPLPPALLLTAGVVPLLAAIAIAGDGASTGAAAAAVGWLVLAGGAAAARPARDRLRWSVPQLVRLGEYAALIWLAAIAGPSSLPAAFAVLAVLAFRHYDLAYRLRHRDALPARWVNLLSGGWDGRLVAAVVALAAGALPAGYYAAAAVLGAAFAAESIAGWRRDGAGRPGYDDEEDEGL